MAAVPTRLEKILERVLVPGRWESEEVEVCFDPTVPDPGGDPGGGGSCQLVITRTVTLTEGGSLQLDPGEFVFTEQHFVGGVTFTLATWVCVP